MNTITLKANLEETLYDWFEQHGLVLKKLRVERRDDEYERPHLHYATGEFAPTYFDKTEDGAAFVLSYDQEVASKDERFENTVLVFPTDTTFRIV